MKVIYILHATIMGGATISFINMLLGLKEKGVQPVVIVPEYCLDAQFLEFVKYHKIEIYRLKLALSYFRSPKNKFDFIRLCKGIPVTYVRKLRGYYQLLKLCKKIKPDIIHTNVGVIHEGFYVAKKLKIPHVWHLREYQKLDFDMNILPSYRYFCSLLKKTNVVTITRDIEKYFKLDNYSKSQTIYNGIFSENEIYYDENKENYFLCASRISSEKGHKDVIKAFGEFCKISNKYELYIAGFGDENYIEELKKTAIEYNCINNIRFLGFIKDIRPFMKKAKSLIVASYNEGFGRMTAEACFCGCIVIGRNTGGTKEILDETGGFQFSDNNGLLQQMINISRLNDEDYKKIALTAQCKAANLYSIENNIEKIYLLYKSIHFKE